MKIYRDKVASWALWASYSRWTWYPFMFALTLLNAVIQAYVSFCKVWKEDWEYFSLPVDSSLDEYLKLERQLLQALTRHDDKSIEEIQDKMDSVWYWLTDEEHEKLNSRTYGDTEKK